MNIIATMALRRALGRQNSIQSRYAAKPAVEMPVLDRASVGSVETATAGPINRLMFLEARRWAIELVASLRGAPAALVIERLAGATVTRPSSYVAGIKSVIDELQAADATDQREDENLTRQAGRKE